MATDLTRRSFYGLCINLLGGAIAAVVAAPAAAYLLIKPQGADNSEDLLEIADLSSVAVGKPREVLFTRTRVDGWKQVVERTSTWLVKDERGEVTAFAPTCTHLGCAYHWETDSKTFLCPCHSSEFDVSGKVLGGPAPRPLDRLLVKVENGKILVDPNQPSKSTPA